MANPRWGKTNLFLATNEFAKVQTDFGVPMLNALLNFRENCEVEWEENVERGEERNCDDVDLIAEPINSRFMRFRFIFNRFTAQRAANYIALKEGVATAMTGVSQNEKQLLTRSGTVSGGAYNLALPFEGRSGATAQIAWNATPNQIRDAMLKRALPTSLGRILQQGDILVSGGARQIETATVVGTISSTGELDVTVTANGMPNSPKTIQVAVEDTDTASIVGGKIRAALIADADIGHATTGFFTISGTGAEVVLTKKAKATNDGTLNIAIANGTAAGLTPVVTSDNTKAGVAPTEWGDGIEIEFTGRYANTNMPLLTADSANITGGGSLVITETQAGSQKSCDITRSLDGEKPLFSFALGDKNGSIATDKYIDAVVESIEFSATDTEPNASMTVTVVCGYLPDEQESFDVPPCVNTSSVKNKDIRLLIDSNYEQRDLVSHGINLNDNVPTAAAFAFDDMDITNPFQRNDQPTQEITSTVYGAKGCNVYNLANAEDVEGNEVPFNTLFGLPKDRLAVNCPETKIKFQTGRTTWAGDLNESAVMITGTPYGISGLPVSYKYWGSQSTQFLLDS